jgi:steroid delta-isomerase-like uncharacterized protein
MIPRQQIIDAAKAPLLTFNEKNWEAVRASISPDFVYEEVATNRKVQGVDQVLPLWQGWATAFPDAKATFHREHLSEDSVVFEVSWRGTHKGPLQTPNGPIAATGNRIDVPACMVIEVLRDKAVAQRHYFDMGTMLRQLGVTA